MERPTILVAVAPEAAATVANCSATGSSWCRSARWKKPSSASPATRDIPFVCCRLLPTMLLRASLRAARHVCDALGAEFVDVRASARLRESASR